jgi:hypothetical protein
MFRNKSPTLAGKNSNINYCDMFIFLNEKWTSRGACLAKRLPTLFSFHLHLLVGARNSRWFIPSKSHHVASKQIYPVRARIYAAEKGSPSGINPLSHLLRPQLCIGAEERLSIDWGDSRICPVSVDKHFWACALIIGFRPRSRRLINRLCAHLTHTGCCFRYYCWFRSPINTHKPLTHIQSADVYANVASSACGKAAPAPFCNQTKFGLFADLITQSVLWLTECAPTWVCLYNLLRKIFVYTVYSFFYGFLDFSPPYSAENVERTTVLHKD